MAADQIEDGQVDQGPQDPHRMSRPSGMSVADLLSGPSGSSTPDSYPRPLQQQKQRTSATIPETLPLKQGSSSPDGDDRTVEQKRPSTARTLSGSGQSKTGMEVSGPVTTENVPAYQYTAMQQMLDNRDHIEYRLTVREQPKHSRMCGVGEKADRRPIDPAPIIQLRVIIHDRPEPTQQSDGDNADDDDDIQVLSASSSSKSSNSGNKKSVLSTTTSASGDTTVRRGVPVRTRWGEGWEDRTWYLENPYYFMYAMLADAETDEELHLLHDGKTRYTTGSCVSCLYHLKDIDGSEQGFFVFPDLSIRVEGRYRLKLCLFETIGHEVHHCKSIYSTPFNVYTAKRFPGMEESTQLSKTFADQGLKVRVRKNPRAKRSRISGKRKDQVDSEDDSDEKQWAMDMSQASVMQHTSSKRAKGEREANWPPQQLASPSHYGPPQTHHIGRYSPPRQRWEHAESSMPAPFARAPTGLQSPAGELSRRGQEQPSTSSLGPDPRYTMPPSLGSDSSRRPNEQALPPARYKSSPHLERSSMGGHGSHWQQSYEPSSYPPRYSSQGSMSARSSPPSRDYPYHPRERSHRTISSNYTEDQSQQQLAGRSSDLYITSRHEAPRDMLPPIHLALSPTSATAGGQPQASYRDGRGRPSSSVTAASPYAPPTSSRSQKQGGNDQTGIPRHMPPPPITTNVLTRSPSSSHGHSPPPSHHHHHHRQQHHGNK